MPRNGAGLYTLPAGQPVVTGTTISSTVFNTLTADLAAEMTNSTDKDGQTVLTNDWDWNGNAAIMDVDGDSKQQMSTDDQWDLTLGGVLELSLNGTKADNLDDIASLTPTNSNFMVGDDTDWVLEPPLTARTSLGLGTGDSPTFAGLTLTAALTVANGGSGAATFGDGFLLLGSGTGAFTALDVTAKGSIVAGDGITDPIALAVGANDTVLRADSAQASGLKYEALSVSMTSETFNSSGTWTKPATVDHIWYILIGGGGGGGSASGGGGGAGGQIQFGFIAVSDDITVTIGAGGATGAPGATGSNSTFAVGAVVTALGGGGGSNAAGANVAGNAGGAGSSAAGGGGGGNSGPGQNGRGTNGDTAQTGGQSTSSGNYGGHAASSGTNPGGGGGKGLFGFGGGGGGGSVSGTDGQGVDGGGNGNGSSGTANTGGGGGGLGGAGGSGVAIIRHFTI